jgi:cold shock CspA family protein
MYDPQTSEGIVVRDTDREELILAPDALEGSLFNFLRQGQRINFVLDAEGRATEVRIGSEPDMGLTNVHV